MASTPNAKKDFERWDRLNHMSLMIMSTTFQKPLGIQNLKRLLRTRVLIPIINQEVNQKPHQGNVEQLLVQDEAWSS
ncbi:hypothetical protein J1N35_044451 [Gossypium stocksii]|uniref:Uncharacterized protein n=1 Tax=Gossypium stocksii TaxID=47602 RepID=A0A9D3U999_9ROSI|nr:hypothetical protein J1N35_044451 [Gossypium stocksii]